MVFESFLINNTSRCFCEIKIIIVVGSGKNVNTSTILFPETKLSSSMSPFRNYAADISCNVNSHMVLCLCVKLPIYFKISNIIPKGIIIIANICCACLLFFLRLVAIVSLKLTGHVSAPGPAEYLGLVITHHNMEGSRLGI